MERTRQFDFVPVSAVVPNPYQPRRTFDEDELAELVASIREVGILQPILVRRLGVGYELVAGERRLRAARLAGLQDVPARIVETVPEESAALALIENLQRSDLSFWDEAEGYRRLVRDFGWTQEALARRMGKSQALVANKLRLLRLEPEVRQVLEQEGLSERHARALLSLEGPAERMEAALEMAGRRLTVREAEQVVARRAPRRSGKAAGIGDARIVWNTLKKALEPLALYGIEAETLQAEQEDHWTFTVRIPKR